MMRATAQCRVAINLWGANMVKALGVIVLIALSGCSGVAPLRNMASPCAVSEASYECQVERYHNVNVQ